MRHYFDNENVADSYLIIQVVVPSLVCLRVLIVLQVKFKQRRKGNCAQHAYDGRQRQNETNHDTSEIGSKQGIQDDCMKNMSIS